jgi:hypothetical protein
VSLRDKLVQAVNRNPISSDDAWAIIHRWDRLEDALRDIEKYPVGDDGYQDVARAALADPYWCDRP